MILIYAVINVTVWGKRKSSMMRKILPVHLKGISLGEKEMMNLEGNIKSNSKPKFEYLEWIRELLWMDSWL